MSYKTEVWMKATLIRCARTFLTTILGVWTAGSLVTDIDWRATLQSAVSATLYIFIVCLVGGLPEVEYRTEDVPPTIEAEEEDENIEQRNPAD